MGGARSTHGRDEKCIQNLGRKPEGKRPLGRPRHSWQYNIRMDLRETEWEGVDSVHLAQDMDQQRALVNTIMNIGVLKKVTKF